MPTEFQKKPLKRGATPSVNLRGGEIDEKVTKRNGMMSLKARGSNLEEPSIIIIKKRIITMRLT